MSWHKLVVAGLVVLATGCAMAPVIRVDQGGPQPHLVELEQKIHADSLQLEKKLAREGAVYVEPAFAAYLQELGGRLVPAGVADKGLLLEFGVVRNPTVNAFALPNGRTYYHLGLISHMRNPDMLAAVMAHELSHVVHRDSLYGLDDFHQKTVAAQIAQIVLVPGAAIVVAGDLANLSVNVIYAGSVTGYGREKEARADADALERLQALGMNPAGTAHMFQVLLKEEEKYQRGPEIWFLMDHPTNRRRLADAEAWLAQHGIAQPGEPRDDPAFLELTDPLRMETAGLDLRFERYFHALEILEDLLARRPDDPAALTLQGECYRRLAEDPKPAELELSAKEWKKIRPKKPEAWKEEWLGKAQGSFAAALRKDPNHAEAHRGVGFLHAARGEKEPAASSLEAYLTLKPEAPDRRYVLSCIERLRKPTDEVKK